MTIVPLINRQINWSTENSLVIDIHSSLHTGAWRIRWCWQNNETQQKINVVPSKFIDMNPEQRHNCKSEVVCDKFVIDGILLKSYYFVLFDLFDPTIEVTSSMIIQKFVTIKYFSRYKQIAENSGALLRKKSTISCLRRESHVSPPVCIIIKILTHRHPKWYVSVIKKTSHFKKSVKWLLFLFTFCINW